MPPPYIGVADINYNFQYCSLPSDTQWSKNDRYVRSELAVGTAHKKEMTLDLALRFVKGHFCSVLVSNIID